MLELPSALEGGRSISDDSMYDRAAVTVRVKISSAAPTRRSQRLILKVKPKIGSTGLKNTWQVLKKRFRARTASLWFPGMNPGFTTHRNVASSSGPGVSNGGMKGEPFRRRILQWRNVSGTAG